MAPDGGRYSDYDLPDPESRRVVSVSEQEKSLRYFKLLKIGGVGATIYSLLHKIVVPLFLKFTTVTRSTYKEIDESWIWAVFFCWTLFATGKSKNTWLALGSGAAIALGFHEAYRFVNGENSGWLALSRALSSGPIAIMGAMVLVYVASRKTLVISWVSTSLAIALTVAVEESFKEHVLSATELTVKTDVQHVQTVSGNSDCGVSNYVHPRDSKHSVSPLDKIAIRACGFSPVVQVKNSQTQFLEIFNNTGQSMNVHLWIYSEGLKKRRSMNFVLAAESQRKIEFNQTLSKAEHILIVSDSNKESGMSVVVDENVLDRKFQATAYPAKIEWSQP